jgi:hypothetical protein
MHKWTEKEKQEFKTKCTQTDTLDGLTFGIIAYDSITLDKMILVKEIKNGSIRDTFSVELQTNKQQTWGTINRKLSLANSYDFIITKTDSFRLSKIKMIMHPQYSMTSEDYGCEIGEYYINDKKKENLGIVFVLN